VCQWAAFTESWAGVGCIPEYNHRKAKAAAGRETSSKVLWKGLNLKFEDWSDNTQTAIPLTFSDGVKRKWFLKVIVADMMRPLMKTKTFCLIQGVRVMDSESAVLKMNGLDTLLQFNRN
jgi:hypothetical protein